MVAKDGITQTDVKRVFQSYSGHLKLFKRTSKTFVQALQKWLPRIHTMTQMEAVSTYSAIVCLHILL